ncbi:hypothetical protein [Streptomyces sp. NBC_00009]|uniref:hypothetical protein n=1 Tax=Streptomyces sp. NBC_00009 TaxID=2975620 RepID=UPI003253258C
MRRCREIDARWYGTSPQKGVIEGAVEFRRQLDDFAGVVAAPTYRTQLDDGLLDIRAVEASTPLARTRLLFAVLTGTCIVPGC